MPDIGSRPKDPFLGFNFVIEMKGGLSPAAGFTECSGLVAETEVLEYKEGGVNDFTHRFWGPTRFPPLVLKRGLSSGDVLWAWCLRTWQGKVERKNISVVLRDRSGAEAMRWTFLNAYPTKWTGPEFRADSAGVAFVSVELSHQGLEPPRAPSASPAASGVAK